MNALIQKLFDNRGYTRDYLLDINNPIHGDLLDIDNICDELAEIRRNKSNIVVLPDFDTDGIMSGVIGFAGLAELGFSVSLFIPNPRDGYGFTPETIDRLVSEYPAAEAIITCDVGITCYEGVQHARKLGLQVFITDHHMQQKSMDDADIVIDPMRLDETYKHPSICGAHVLYQVLERYALKYGSALEQEQIRRLRVFAGIGTVSDVMPLLYENRQLVRDSVSICRLIYSGGDDSLVQLITGCDVYRRAFYGLYCFCLAASDCGTLKHTEDIDEEFYAYYMAPALNSVKRMDENMEKAFGLFFGPEPRAAASELIKLNAQRKYAVRSYMTGLNNTSQPYAPFAYITDAPKGILGLMANRIAAQAGFPVLVLNEGADGSFSGSGRSPDWYPFLDRAVPKGFYAAGHNAAFGIGFSDKAELESFIKFIDEDADAVYETCVFTEAKPDFVIASDGSGDTGIDTELFADYLSELDYYKPFGKSFPAPDARIRFTAEESEWIVMGSTKQHLKIRLPYGFEVICWNQGNRIGERDTKDTFEVAGRIASNTYNGVTSIGFVGTLL